MEEVAAILQVMAAPSATAQSALHDVYETAGAVILPLEAWGIARAAIGGGVALVMILPTEPNQEPSPSPYIHKQLTLGQGAKTVKGHQTYGV